MRADGSYNAEREGTLCHLCLDPVSHIGTDLSYLVNSSTVFCCCCTVLTCTINFHKECLLCCAEALVHAIPLLLALDWCGLGLGEVYR